VLHAAADTSAIRGVWMYGSTLSSQDSKSIAEKLADNYVKQVYLLIKGTSGTKTSAALLTDFITEAHAKNIQVHLWYAVGQDDAFLSSHAEAHVYHCPKPSIGYPRPYPMESSLVNLLYPGYKEYVMNNIKYFLTNFDCDGIHLDYIRYSHMVYSFDKYHLEKAGSLGCDTARIIKLFNDDYNYYAVNDGFASLYSNGDADVTKWVNMRSAIVRDYIAAIKDSINSLKPGIALTASFMPEGATTPQWAEVYYSQNYALNSPLLDAIIPMAYFKDYSQSTSWIKTVTEGAIQLADPECKIAAGLQAYGGVTASEISQQIDYALSGKSCGAVLFRYETLDSEGWSVVKEKFGELSGQIGINEIEEAVPAGYRLNQNYPNPFNPVTAVNFQTAKEGLVVLKIYNCLGKEVSTLLNEDLSAGSHKVSFDASGLPSGIYFYRIISGNFTAVKKMILLK
jgi:uncharacterized lipoprotein YddW (UPF0748 family)